MKTNLKSISILTLLFTSLIILSGCTSKETPSPKTLEFDGKTEDLTGLKVIYTKEVDVNKDNTLDKIVVYGKKEDLSIERGKYIVFIDGKDDKTLTTVECGLIDTTISDVYDLDGDGTYEILMDSHSGGTAGGGSYLLGYKDKTYKTINVKSGQINVTMEKGYKVKVSDSTTGKISITNLTLDQRKRYTAAGVFDSNGNPIPGGEKAFLGIGAKGISDKLIDINNDGNLEYVSQTLYGGTYNADVVVGINIVYGYDNGDLLPRDLICQANTSGYNKDYNEPEEYIAPPPPPPEIPSNGTVDLVIWSGSNSSSGKSIKGDEVKYSVIDGVPPYKIDGIDNKLVTYKVDDGCVIDVMDFVNNSSGEAKSLSFDEFLTFINKTKEKYPDAPRSRLFKATVTNGKIVKLSFIFTP